VLIVNLLLRRATVLKWAFTVVIGSTAVDLLGCAPSPRVAGAPPPTSTIDVSKRDGSGKSVAHATQRSTPSTETSGMCPAAPSFEEASRIAEFGLCSGPAEFLGEPVCKDWHAFLNGSTPRLASRTFAVGPTFRVERARTGALVWSEMNPIYALYNAGDSPELSAVNLLDISPDNDEEAKEGQEYLVAAFRKRRNSASSLQAYIEQRITTTPTLRVQTTRDGRVSDLGCRGQLYIRQSGERVYALLASKHSNAWEYDSHPVLYFMILALP
jgi:hypothetical protein